MGWLKPEEEVAIAIEMTDACVQIWGDGIKAQIQTSAKKSSSRNERKDCLFWKLRMNTVILTPEKVIKDKEDVRAISALHRSRQGSNKEANEKVWKRWEYRKTFQKVKQSLELLVLGFLPEQRQVSK